MSKQKKVKTAAEIIRARRIALNTKQEYLSLFSRIVVLALAAYIIFTQVFLITQNRGQDMFPAVKDGDLIIAFRMQKEYAKNDVVVYTVDGKQEVGRIIGRETDVVTMDESGKLLVNGTVQSGEIMYPTYAKEGLEYPYKVPEGHVFLLGDYRTNSEDSRDHGSISMRNVEGKVITILRRRGL
ncbi:MAG: signal peptidase I [Lachnospiraceae bacterium]|nr:signal peptidase I [Lachnospiraceae bacterium]